METKAIGEMSLGERGDKERVKALKATENQNKFLKIGGIINEL
ncbi:hypothetical protein [Maledivibacter halophilus]|uniref:Uncharacterized protein n=1 Tax=Maledivibacter halophilus TaxID=36842 RepID=A0A1T5L362_9FIRM|nr:hypothetical protein [Maledivibacter halophilus]SKC70457.1 hypothetical protein SAMN02194393_02442 [Maledivibacter halophilus]